MSARVNNWVICFTGALQHEGNDVGVVRLWNELRTKHSSPDTCILLYSWDHSVDHLAELMWRLVQLDSLHANILVVGYSWGGMTAVNLCRALDRRGDLMVRDLVLCDAVYRHRYRFGYWRSLASWFTIKIPSNVCRVRWFRQYENRPRGHNLKAKSIATDIQNPVTLNVKHNMMDDQPRFHELCESIVSDYTRNSKGEKR